MCALYDYKKRIIGIVLKSLTVYNIQVKAI